MLSDSLAPQPTDKPADTRTRFNSLDSGILLTNPVYAEHSESPVEHLRVPTPPSATPPPPGAAVSGTGKNSVALRAMRSVRSLARIGSWAQLKPNPDAATAAAATVKDKESDGKKKKKKKDKDKEKERDKAKETIRYSGSSFEAGALSASPAASKNEFKSLGKKKASILGLGLPSTMRLPSSRSGSTASSIVAANHRLSADSATLLGGGILARGRSGSTMSAASSLRPMSTKSSGSRESSGSSGAASVRWDEVGLQTVKEIRRKDKETKNKDKETRSKEKDEKKKLKKTKSGKDSSRKSSDSRKRTALAAIFPGIVAERELPITSIVEGTTVDGHELGRYEAKAGDSPMETPMKYVRPRPVSEQPLARGRPKPLHEGDDGEILFAITRTVT